MLTTKEKQKILEQLGWTFARKSKSKGRFVHATGSSRQLARAVEHAWQEQQKEG